MKKLICMGECLIDFLPLNNDGVSYVAKAGGAPANVSACVGKLGGNAVYLGKMSMDGFGKFLLGKLRDSNVDTSYVKLTDKYNTGLAVVSLDEFGDRQFSFYRSPSADMMLEENEVAAQMFEQGDVLHFCSVGLVESPTKYAHKKAVEYALEKGTLISFDVNVRLPLWESEDKCKQAVLEFLPFADIVKVTDDELSFITHEASEDIAIEKLFKLAKRAKLIFVTKGKHGVSVFDRQMASIDREAVDVKVVDTTGAGDCFSGCVLYSVLEKQCELNLENIKEIVDFASYGCGVVIGRKGAIESMPTLGDIENLKKEF